MNASFIQRIERNKFILSFVVIAFILPFIDPHLPKGWHLADQLRPIFIFAILGLGLNIVTGFAGLLNLGIAAFMAIGAYAYGILTCNIYPFQIGFWWGIIAATVAGCCAGLLLGLPTLRLRGDYLAIVTLGFGEIIQDTLRNLDLITQGTMGINPLPNPRVGNYVFPMDDYRPWYYLLLFILILVLVMSQNLEKSRVGRSWMSIREDELAAHSMGINPVKTKLLAFATGAALASLAGALWASYLGSTGEPGNYDFQLSVIVVCIIIIGGLGSVRGVLLGALIMIGFNSILLVRLSEFLARKGLTSNQNVLLSPGNWKYLIFGLALILMMRFRPEGFLASKEIKEELHSENGQTGPRKESSISSAI